jgi:hypothetical protein
MTIFRYKGNGLLYTITVDRRGHNHKAHPYKHNEEIGVKFSSHARFRDFKSGMTMNDFETVSVC